MINLMKTEQLVIYTKCEHENVLPGSFRKKPQLCPALRSSHEFASHFQFYEELHGLCARFMKSRMPLLVGGGGEVCASATCNSPGRL